MNRALLVLDVVLAVTVGTLWCVSTSLERGREERSRAESTFHAFARLGTPGIADVARVDLTVPGSSRPWIYERRAQGWRIPQYRDVFADRQAIEALLHTCIDGRGVEVGRMPADAAHFGIVAGRTLEVDCHDAAGKSILRALFGSVAPGPRGDECFASASVHDRILHLNANPWPCLSGWTAASRFPPMTDLRVTPLALGRSAPTKLTFAGAPTGREMVRREVPAGQRPPIGERGPRYEWYAIMADGEKRLQDAAAVAFVRTVSGLEFDDVAEGSPDSTMFADAPTRLTIEYDGGARDTLSLGRADSNGAQLLHHSATGQVFVLGANKVKALSPDWRALLTTPPTPAPPAAGPPAPPSAAVSPPVAEAAVVHSEPRFPDYQQARLRARAWLDQLVVDPVDLMHHGVKGKKKLAEILDVYWNMLQFATDANDRDAIRARLVDLAGQAARPEYHDLATLSEQELRENSMSYLRVACLLRMLGLDTGSYELEIRRVKARLDEHVKARGPWQRTMLLEYYKRLGLDPPAMDQAPLQDGVFTRRPALASYTDDTAYELTHEVFVAFDYGATRTQTLLSATDVAYARELLPALALRYVAARNDDLVGELSSCMTYLGLRAEPAFRRALDRLLDSQNPNGSWGEYESLRPQFGPYLEQHVYLHTTAVVLDALMSAYEERSGPSHR